MTRSAHNVAYRRTVVSHSPFGRQSSLHHSVILDMIENGIQQAAMQNYVTLKHSFNHPQGGIEQNSDTTNAMT